MCTKNCTAPARCSLLVTGLKVKCIFFLRSAPYNIVTMARESTVRILLLVFLLLITNIHICLAFLSSRLESSSWQNTRLQTGNTQHFALDPLIFVSNFAESENVPEYAIPFLVSSASVLALTVFTPFELINSNLLESIVSGTYLEKRKKQLRRVYKASKDGWSAISFHEAVDGSGSGVVVARTIGGATFGGYNPNGWMSTDDYYTSSAAFLWCLKGGRVVKLPVLPGGNCAVFDYATSGPCFGAADLMIGPPRAAVMGGFAGPDAEDISKSAGSLRRCKSAVGSTFNYDPAWPVRGTAQLLDVEVYCISDDTSR
jgi:TLD